MADSRRVSDEASIEGASVVVSAYDARGGRPYQQDAFDVRFTEAAALAVVADGHGERGDEVARIVRDDLGGAFARGGDWEAAFAEVHARVLCDVPVATSGACVVAARATALGVEVAWAGDCRALLFDCGSRQLERLTRDHRAGNPAEGERVARFLAATESELPDVNAEQQRRRASVIWAASRQDVARMWPRYPPAPAQPPAPPAREFGSMITRGIGDAYLRDSGYIHTPEVARRDAAGAYLLLLHSDGVSDALSDAELRNTLLANTGTARDLARRVTNLPALIIRQCLQKLPEGSDNITVVALLVQPTPPAYGKRKERPSSASDSV